MEGVCEAEGTQMQEERKEKQRYVKRSEKQEEDPAARGKEAEFYSI